MFWNLISTSYSKATSHHQLRYFLHTEIVAYQIFPASSTIILQVEFFDLVSGYMVPRGTQSFVTCRRSFRIERFAGTFKPKASSILGISLAFLHQTFSSRSNVFLCNKRSWSSRLLRVSRLKFPLWNYLCTT